MSKWGKWTPAGRLRCPNCGYYCGVPPKPQEKIEQPKEKPDQIARVGGYIMFDKAMPSAILPASVKLRPVFRDTEKRVVCQAGLATLAVAIPTVTLSDVIALYNGWNVGLIVGAATVVVLGIVLPLSIVHYFIVEPGEEKAQPVIVNRTEDEKDDEPEPLGDTVAYSEVIKTDGGWQLNQYPLPSSIARPDHYIALKYVRIMASRIYGNHYEWISELEFKVPWLPSIPSDAYRSIRRQWIEEFRWAFGVGNKTYVTPPGKRWLEVVATREPGDEPTPLLDA